MFKIALNAGHGINTAGKRCLKSLDANETREWTLNSRICNKIEEKLKAYNGYELIRLDDVTGRTDVALATRTNKANAFNADFYLAIHHNAGVNGKSGGGVIAITYTNVGNDTKAYQEALYNAIVAKTGLRGNRAAPLQKQNLHEVRCSKMPAVLLECGFMDSSTDVPIILTDDFADKVATACVEVLVEKGGLTKKVVEAPKPTTPTARCYANYNGKATGIVDALKDMGIDSSFAYRSKIAKANGIKLYTGTAKQNITMLTLLKQGKLIKP